MTLRRRGYLVEGEPSPGVVDLKNPIYHTKEKAPRYNTPISPVGTHAGSGAGANMLKRRLPSWTKADHEKAAAKLVKMISSLEEKYSQMLDAAAKETWGRKWNITDYRVSCVGSDEFSQKRKEQLRKVCRDLSVAKGALASHRHLSTYMR